MDFQDLQTSGMRFRSVPLIQRADMTPLGSTGAVERFASAASRPSSRLPYESALHEAPLREESFARRREGHTKDRSRYEDGRRGNRERETDGHVSTRDRSRRDDRALSGYMPAWVGGDSSALRTSRDETTAWQTARERPSWQGVPDRQASHDSVPAWQPDGYDGASWMVYGGAVGHGSASQYVTARRARPISSADLADRRSSRGQEGSWEVRPAVYTDEDYYGSQALAGSSSRREALRAGLTAIPYAVGSLLGKAAQHMRGMLVLLVAALVVLMLYTPLRNLYMARRQLDDLQVTYDALLEENDQIRQELELLQTREGIENEARARGFVEEGETKVVVENLPEEYTVHDGAAEALAEPELPDTRPWYTCVLDAMFGYDPKG